MLDDGVTCVFDSKFESGNLRKAIKMTDYEYNLIISSDTNCIGQNHWYYFSVINPRKTTINFNILNMLKYDDLYKTGLKPAVYSTKYFAKTGVKWHRDCNNIVYKPNNDYIPGRKYYMLSFSYDFRFNDDKVFFAYSIPYTYQELTSYLCYVKEKYPKICRVNPLCKTISGNICEFLTITNNIKTYQTFEEEIHEWGISSAGRRMLKNKKTRKNMQAKILGKEIEDEHEKKSGMVITARVHSGETVSSFMMCGVLEFLLGNTREARILRKKFIFKIVPMLNPDGVRYGNYRCSLIGVDLNRRWEKPNRQLHPTIYYTKKMIEVFSEHHTLLMCCDLHGHTRKRNVFMYGCAIKSMDCLTLRRNLMAKVIPVEMSKRSKFFTFKDCHFRLEKSKNSTARIVLYKDFNITHSYTMEASFFGPLNKKFQVENYHMNEKDLQSVGESLCKTCLIFVAQNKYLAKIRSTNNFLRRIMMKRRAMPNVPVQAVKAEIENEIIEEYANEEEKSCGEIKIDFYDEQKDHVEKENNEIRDDTCLRLEDEKIWEGIEIAHYSESDEEGSGGSDSCPSEKLDDSILTKDLIIAKSSPKRKIRKEKKKNNLVLENIKYDTLPEYPHSSIEVSTHDRSEQLKKAHSLKPKYGVLPSKKEYIKDYNQKIEVPKSQNYTFQYPTTMPAVNENPLESPNKDRKNTQSKRRNNIRLSENIEERQGHSLSVPVKLPHNFNYSFERTTQKRGEREGLFTFSGTMKHVSEYSWISGKGTYFAKNFADSARYRIDKMYSKFPL